MSAFGYCESLILFDVLESIQHIGEAVVYGCDRLLTTVKYNEDDDGNILNGIKVNQWLMQRHDYLPFHQACSSTSITPHDIEGCIQEHGIESASEVDDEQMTALHILCANPHVTGDVVRAYLTPAAEAANVPDGTGMTGLQKLCSLPH